jgi:hypothetical protein
MPVMAARRHHCHGGSSQSRGAAAPPTCRVRQPSLSPASGLSCRGSSHFDLSFYSARHAGDAAAGHRMREPVLVLGRMWPHRAAAWDEKAWAFQFVGFRPLKLRRRRALRGLSVATARSTSARGVGFDSSELPWAVPDGPA